MVDIQLGQGDSDDIPVVLTEDGKGSNLNGSVVHFVLSDELGNGKYDIICAEGIKDQVTNEIITEFSVGGITIPITGVHTKDTCELFGEFIVMAGDKQVTFSNDDNYVTMKVKRKLSVITPF